MTHKIKYKLTKHTTIYVMKHSRTTRYSKTSYGLYIF